MLYPLSYGRMVTFNRHCNMDLRDELRFIRCEKRVADPALLHHHCPAFSRLLLELPRHARQDELIPMEVIRCLGERRMAAFS